MHNCSKVTFALVACWLFAVTVVSDFLTFSSGSTTSSVEVFSKTSLQSVISASSTEFTVQEFLMAISATPTYTASFTAVVNYPEITTAAVFPPVVSSTALVTSPFSTTVHIVVTLILASVTPVGSPGAGLPAPTPSQFSPRYKLENLNYLDFCAQIKPYTYPCAFNCTCTTPERSPAPSPALAPPEPTTKEAAPIATGICGRPGQAGGGHCGGWGIWQCIYLGSQMVM